MIKVAKLRRIKKSNYEWLTFLAAFEEESFTRNHRQCGNKLLWIWLKIPSPLCLRWRQDGVKMRLIPRRDRDLQKVVLRSISIPRPRSQVLQHYHYLETDKCLLFSALMFEISLSQVFDKHIQLIIYIWNQTIYWISEFSFCITLVSALAPKIPYQAIKFIYYDGHSSLLLHQKTSV